MLKQLVQDRVSNADVVSIMHSGSDTIVQSDCVYDQGYDEDGAYRFLSECIDRDRQGKTARAIQILDGCTDWPDWSDTRLETWMNGRYYGIESFVTTEHSLIPPQV